MVDIIIGFIDIKSYVAVTGAGNNIGGIAGTLSAVQPNYCSSSGDVSGVNNVGGMVGLIVRAPTYNCKSFGNVTATG